MPTGVYIRTNETKRILSISLKGNGLGRKLSDETKRKISKKITEIRTGVKLTDHHRKAISEAKKGNKSIFWKGGITPEEKRLRSTAEYKHWRTAVLERDNKTCVECGENKKRIVADHIKPFNTNPELIFVIDNGRTLCDKCHFKTPSFGWKSYHSKNKGSDKYKACNTQKKPVIQKDLNGNIISEFESRNETARKLGFDRAIIGACVTGRMKKYKGFIFEYKQTGRLK